LMKVIYLNLNFEFFCCKAKNLFFLFNFKKN